MTLALDKPHLVQNLISVDNAPVDAALKSDFGKYLQGMREVEDTRVQKQSEADEILRTFEDVRLVPPQAMVTSIDSLLEPPHQTVPSDQSHSNI